MDLPTATTSTNTPAVATRDTATPRPALQVTGSRKIQCRGLTAKNKNVVANTLSVLQAMRANPPFARSGKRRSGWEAVANLARSNPDLLHVTGALCQARYIQVRDEYKASQAEAARAASVSLPAPAQQKAILEELIRLEEGTEELEEEAEGREGEGRHQQAYSAVDQRQQQAEAEVERDVAAFSMADSYRKTTLSTRSASITNTSSTSKPATTRRKRKASDDLAKYDKLNDLLQLALEKYLSK
ncbi:hypothetical protein EDD11_000949 [Mortierella claussenii]|nr:hypothetical protein EDD11_000949 [Mortierella claussenii]